MLTLYNATIDCSKEQAAAYEWARGEYEVVVVAVDPDTDAETKEERPINPIRFPLRGALITHSGGRTIISLPAGEAAAFRLDEIAKSAEPKKESKGRRDIYTVSGTSMRLLRQNIAVEHAQVTFTIAEWDAEHLPNQRLGVRGE